MGGLGCGSARNMGNRKEDDIGMKACHISQDRRHDGCGSSLLENEWMLQKRT